MLLAVSSIRRLLLLQLCLPFWCPPFSLHASRSSDNNRHKMKYTVTKVPIFSSSTHTLCLADLLTQGSNYTFLTLFCIVPFLCRSFIGSVLQGRDIIIIHQCETGQSLASLHSRVMWSPLLYKHFHYNSRIHLFFTILSTMCFQFSMFISIDWLYHSG
jgi:hypothetical protein